MFIMYFIAKFKGLLSVCLLQSIDSGKNSPLVSLCLCLGLLGRRALGTAAHNTTTTAG